MDEAEHILGLRLNLWTCAIVLLVGVIGFVVSARRHPGREDLRAPVQEDAPDEAGSYPDS